MSKKALILSAAGVVAMGTLNAYAGGPDILAAPPCSVSPFVPFLYIGASAGWAYSDWNSFIVSGLPQEADTNGFAYGGKAGYQFSDLFGIEGGGYVLPDSNQTVSLLAPGSQNSITASGRVQSWVAYGAATIRGNLPGNPFFHIMGKVGGAYRALNHSGTLYDNVGNGSYGTVVFGANVEYDLAAVNLPLALGVDYLYVPSSNDSWVSSGPSGISKNAAPAAQVVVGTVSLHFAV